HDRGAPERVRREVGGHKIEREGAEEEVVFSAVESEAAGAAARAQLEPGLERIARAAVGAASAHPTPEQDAEAAGAEGAGGEADRGDDVTGIRAHAIIYPGAARAVPGATTHRAYAGHVGRARRPINARRRRPARSRPGSTASRPSRWRRSPGPTPSPHRAGRTPSGPA